MMNMFVNVCADIKRKWSREGVRKWIGSTTANIIYDKNHAARLTPMSIRMPVDMVECN
jgi:hypothetical protein